MGWSMDGSPLGPFLTSLTLGKLRRPTVFIMRENSMAFLTACSWGLRNYKRLEAQKNWRKKLTEESVYLFKGQANNTMIVYIDSIIL
ncbi:hypothetical protein LINPERPRIM_LOCUS24629 [Linum perenne]